MPDILILKGDREPSKSGAHSMWLALKQIGNANYFLENYSDVVFRINNGEVSCFVYDSGRDVASFDLVYVRDFHGFEHERNAVALYLSQKNRRFINDDTRRFQHISKLTQYMALAGNNVPVPDMIYAKQEYLADLGEGMFPAVLKSVVGSNGANNVLVRNPGDLARIAVPKGVLQPFIPNDHDTRVIVADANVLLAYKRVRGNQQDHRNNVAVGARREVMTDAPNDLTALAITAARTLGRNVAGVDIIQNQETGGYYVLEVNFNFGMAEVGDGIAQQYYRKLADYLLKKAL
jgi:glutathione synthase/RimK-type ligase-like ATP-grasp enzyme